MPERIQLRRTKGWRKPEGAIVVARPSRWGNPFRVVNESGNGWCLRGIPERRGEWTNIGRELACAYAKSLYRQWLAGDHPEIDQPRPDLEPLRGHDLACWCPLDFACHADVLLDYVNGRSR